MSHRSQPSSLKLVIIPLILSALACSLPGLRNDTPETDREGPLVTISSPTAGQSLELGRQIAVQSSSVDAEGVVRVELIVNGQVVWIDANAQPEPNAPFIVAQPWQPDVPGTYVIQVKAYDPANSTGQSEALTIEVTAASAQVLPEPSATATITEGSPLTSTPVAVIEDAATPSVTPTSDQAAEEPPVAPSPTQTILPTTPTATPTPGTFAETGIEPHERFKDIWETLGSGESRLGYPTGPAFTDRDFAKQFFERGLMFWWDNPEEADLIWVLDSPAPDQKSGTTSNRYPEDWNGKDEYSCNAARSNDDLGPIRGFGKLWCERPELQTRLGNPLERESGSGGSPPYSFVQFYQAGVMLYNPINNEVYVLFDQGDWQRFGP